MHPRMFLTAIAATCAVLITGGHATAADPFIIVQSTTSTQNSGLFEYLLPKFQEATGIEARVPRIVMATSCSCTPSPTS